MPLRIFAWSAAEASRALIKSCVAELYLYIPHALTEFEEHITKNSGGRGKFPEFSTFLANFDFLSIERL
jgi:hypothetical protein